MYWQGVLAICTRRCHLRSIKKGDIRRNHEISLSFFLSLSNPTYYICTFKIRQASKIAITYKKKALFIQGLYIKDLA